MPSLQELQRVYDEFICSAIESEYSTPGMTKPDLEEIKNKLIEIIEQYYEEIENEQY